LCRQIWTSTKQNPRIVTPCYSLRAAPRISAFSPKAGPILFARSIPKNRCTPAGEKRKRWERNAGLRLDHILLSSALRERLHSAGVDRQTRVMEGASDHAPVWVSLTTLKRSLRRVRSSPFPPLCSKAAPTARRTPTLAPMPRNSPANMRTARSTAGSTTGLCKGDHRRHQLTGVWKGLRACRYPPHGRCPASSQAVLRQLFERRGQIDSTRNRYGL
jgi:hypothetical protein